MLTKAELSIKNLGERAVVSPLQLSTVPDDDIADFVLDQARVLMHVETHAGREPDTSLQFEKAGPRQHIFFEPSRTTVGIVTCGGLCPGLNSVIRSMVLELRHTYGVREVIGFRYGYEGLNPHQGVAPLSLGVEAVRHIHKQGGSLLGVSRGGQDPRVMVLRHRTVADDSCVDDHTEPYPQAKPSVDVPQS